MKRFVAAIFAAACFLTGCSDPSEMDKALQLRQELQQKACQFSVEIVADYGEYTHTFSMGCDASETGDIAFTVIAPETIQGITGSISQDGGNLTFDDQILAFPTMADDQITPVSAPWVLLRTLRGGYIRACGESEQGLKLIIDDSYQEDSLQLDIWLDENDFPKEAEILWKGRRVLSLKVTEFVYV